MSNFDFQHDRAELYSQLKYFLNEYITKKKAESSGPEYVAYRNVISTLERILEEISE
jgi:hypothetical protein